MQNSRFYKISFLLGTLLVLSLRSHAQVMALPESLTLYDEFYSYLNTATLTGGNSFRLTNQSRVGTFADFRQFYGIGSISLGKQNNKGLAIGFYVSQDGKLISENRFNLAYWNDIKLSENWKMTLSLQSGIINKSLGGTKSTAGSNSFTPDINIGMNIGDNKNIIAFSFNQIGNFKQTPFQQSIIYKQFGTFFYKRKININHQTALELSTHLLLADLSEYRYFAKSNLIYKETVAIGLGISKQGMLGSFTWKKLPFLKSNLETSFGVLIPVFDSVSSFYYPFQIQLKYLLKK